MIKIMIKKAGKVISEKAMGEFALSIGSNDGSEIKLPPEDASPDHASISLLGDRILIEDLKSEKGTYLKGERISSEFIEPGESIQIGSYTLEVQRDDLRKKVPSPETHEDIELKKRRRLEEALKPDPDWPSLTSYKKEARSGMAPKPSEEKTELEIRTQDERPSKVRDEKEDISSKKGSKAVKKEPGEGGMRPLKRVDGPRENTDDTMAISPKFEPRLFGTKDRRYYPLNEDENVIGRGEDCEIILSDKSISTKHAKIVKRGKDLVVVDLQSTNGTRVNGENIEEKTLRCHDLVEFGDLKFEFLEGAVEPSGESSKFELLGDTKPKMMQYTPPKERTPRDEIARIARSKKGRFYIFVVLMTVLALATVYYLKSPKEPQKGPDSMLEQYGIEEAEKERIILHNLEMAKEALGKKDYEEARKILNIVLTKIDRDNMEAKRLLASIDNAVTREKERISEEQRLKEEREEKIAFLTTQGKKMLSQNNFEGSKSAFGSVLAIDPSNDTALRYMERIKVLEDRTAKERKILKERLKEIEAFYYQGISYYEEGNYDDAADVLRKVVEYRSTNFYQSATKILSEIQKKQMMNIESQLSEVDTLMRNEELLKAENILKSILRHFPDNSKAGSMYSRVHGQIVEKAKKVYQEGIVYENVVEDVKSAIESYEEVLKLLPDPNEEYHQKAKERLKKLK